MTFRRRSSQTLYFDFFVRLLKIHFEVHLQGLLHATNGDEIVTQRVRLHFQIVHLLVEGFRIDVEVVDRSWLNVRQFCHELGERCELFLHEGHFRAGTNDGDSRRGEDSLTASDHLRHRFEELLNRFSPMSIFLSILDNETFDRRRDDGVCRRPVDVCA